MDAVKMEALEKSKQALMPMRSDERLAKKITREVLSQYQLSSILDVGCGDGIVGREIQENVYYQGLDINEACIYEKDYKNTSIQYVKGEQIPDLMVEQGPWDMILLLDVIEHTPQFTDLFESALQASNKYVVVSLPNEIFMLDRLRMLAGRELNAHSLDLVGQPIGFKHQYIINIKKARNLLNAKARDYGFDTSLEILRPLIPKNPLLRPLSVLTTKILSSDAWSQGSIFIFEKANK